MFDKEKVYLRKFSSFSLSFKNFYLKLINQIKITRVNIYRKIKSNTKKRNKQKIFNMNLFQTKTDKFFFH